MIGKPITKREARELALKIMYDVEDRRDELPIG